MLSDILKDLRQRKDITQAELAEYLGITQQAVARWERNKSEPDLETLKTLANYFNVSTDYLLGNERRNFGDDEERLISEYRKLDVFKKKTLLSMLAFLISPQGATAGNVVQSTQNGHNLYSNSGNNIVMG